MIREIVTDEEILSKPCEAATAEDAAIADDLVETLLASDEASYSTGVTLPVAGGDLG